MHTALTPLTQEKGGSTHRVELICEIVKCEAKLLLVFCSDLEFNGFEWLYLNPVILPEDPGLRFCLSKVMDSKYEKHNNSMLACVAQNSEQWFWSRKYQRNIAQTYSYNNIYFVSR